MGRVLPFARRARQAAVCPSPMTARALARALKASPVFQSFIQEGAIVAKLSLQAKPAVKAKVEPLTVTSTKINTLLEERITVGVKFSQIEAKKKKLDQDIAATVEKKTGRKDGALKSADFTCAMIGSSNKYVDPVLLLKAGVKASIIAKCTRTTAYYYPRVTRNKEEVPDDSPTNQTEDGFK